MLQYYRGTAGGRKDGLYYIHQQGSSSVVYLQHLDNMLVSNRLLRAAMSALANQLAADADAAIKRYESSTVYTDYAREACTVRAVLEQMGEDVSISSAKVLLPGEKAWRSSGHLKMPVFS